MKLQRLSTLDNYIRKLPISRPSSFYLLRPQMHAELGFDIVTHVRFRTSMGIEKAELQARKYARGQGSCFFSLTLNSLASLALRINCCSIP